MRKRRLTRVIAVLAAVLIACGALYAVAWRTAIPPAKSTDKKTFDPPAIANGAALAAIGNCNVCHTRAGGEPYAGGRPIATPFGSVFSTNITPDVDTGIGAWTEAAFLRAMREGVSRDGHHLYPAFPYDHMTKATDEDIKAVYAFIMTRRPVRATAPANDLAFPFNIRSLVAAWKLLFFRRGVFTPDPTQSASWNRGAYLVEGLAHCGACHTPRNILGAEKRDRPYAGGTSDGWIAPALDAHSPAAVPWTADRLHAYLRHGFDAVHGVAAGPMAPVVRNLSTVPDEDVEAIATYVAFVAGTPSPERRMAGEKAMSRARQAAAPEAAASGTAGAGTYAGACAQCHGEAGRVPSIPALNLALSSTLRMPRPDNVVRIIRYGIQSPERDGVPLMPGFANVFSHDQLVALVAFLRADFTDLPPWSGIDTSISRSEPATEGIKSANRGETTK